MELLHNFDLNILFVYFDLYVEFLMKAHTSQVSQGKWYYNLHVYYMFTFAFD